MFSAQVRATGTDEGFNRFCCYASQQSIIESKHCMSIASSEIRPDLNSGILESEQISLARAQQAAEN